MGESDFEEGGTGGGGCLLSVKRDFGLLDTGLVGLAALVALTMAPAVGPAKPKAATVLSQLFVPVSACSDAATALLLGFRVGRSCMREWIDARMEHDETKMWSGYNH